MDSESSVQLCPDRCISNTEASSTNFSSELPKDIFDQTKIASTIALPVNLVIVSVVNDRI